MIDGSIAVFGTVIEYERDLLVLGTDHSRFRLNFEPVSWRVFPRSRFYTNQLHVVADDHLRILSFNHDYLLDQANKLAGVANPREPAGAQPR